ADVIQYLRFFTWLDQAEIDTLAESMESEPERREAQRTLAREITRMVHDETALAAAEKASQVLFGGEMEGLRAAEVADIFQDVPSSEVAKTELSGEGIGLIDLLVSAGLASGRGDARRLLQGGGVYLNNHKVDEVQKSVQLNDAIEGKFLLLRKGRKNYHLIKVV
ncbi:MAG: tyrosine--tRNA ligase, partial [Calditrichaeota bacterium]|nr:tyrosine--tRNA ligase [Calditrichota bacterium]